MKDELEKFRALQRKRNKRAEELKKLQEQQAELKRALIEGNRPASVRGVSAYDVKRCINPPRLTEDQRRLQEQNKRKSERKGGYYGGNTRPITSGFKKFTLEWGEHEGEQACYDHWDRLHCIGFGPINDEENGYIVHGHDCDHVKKDGECPLVRAKNEKASDDDYDPRRP